MVFLQPSATALRIAVEGCGHGTLNEIYASVKKSCELKGWPGVDLLIIGGDFQAVRNAYDLKAVSMPSKYYAMHDFHEYYSGVRTAPYLTIFIGGNHEASNYMWELYYGGWAAPNIYYMGAANIIRLGPLRIAGLSGIWKGYDYKKPHHERLPYNNDDIRSIFHVRELDTRKLLQLRSQVDIGLSHDWPKGMEWKGNYQQLFRCKSHFEEDANNGRLGSVAATLVLERLRPAYWFSAHMHVKYAAVWEHKPQPSAAVTTKTNGNEISPGSDDQMPIIVKNEAEIDLDMDMDDDQEDVTDSNAKDEATTRNEETGQMPVAPQNQNERDNTTDALQAQVQQTDATEDLSVDLRNLLPQSFARPEPMAALPFPREIHNQHTKFLALDKCLPGRHFLQLMEVTPFAPTEIVRPLTLSYDKEWLAITRVFASSLTIGDAEAHIPPDQGDAHYRPLIEHEMEWVTEHLVKAGKMEIPQDFTRTAAVYEPSTGIHVAGLPQEFSNPHTQGFCALLQIANPFHASEEERTRRMQEGPRADSAWSGHTQRGAYRGSMRASKGRGRGRGQHRGRGRW